MTDEVIMSYDNVPVTVAAEYLGKTPPSLYAALRYKRAPFGWAVLEGDNSKRWTYHISPGLLIAYKRGTLKVEIHVHDTLDYLESEAI